MVYVNPIKNDVFLESVEKQWPVWTIRITVLFSLFVQILLIVLAPNRKRSFRKRLALIIWSGNLVVDATADTVVGLISSIQSSKLSKDNRDLITFWLPFLLVHLGGPVLALEDNELWLHHFLTLIFQVLFTLYVFLQSLSKNKLMIPMILMLISGCIKYLKRTMSLYLTSGDRLLDDGLPMTTSLSGQFDDDLQLVHTAYRLFRVFKCRFADLIVRPIERNQSWRLFNSIPATTALRLIEVELNFMYDIAFTKTMVVHTFMGFLFRFFSLCCLIASLAVFRFYITKHGVFNGINVGVTYVLFLGAVALELIEFLMVVLSDWTVVAMIESQKTEESPGQNWWRRIVARVFHFLRPAFLKIWRYWTPRWYLEESAQPNDQELRTPLLFRRWSGCLSGHNLIRYCLKGRPSGIHNRKSNLCVPIVRAISYAQLDWVIDRVGLRDLLDEMSCLSREPLRISLWNLIFQQLRKKSDFGLDRDRARQIASAKGEWVLQENSDLDEDIREKLKEYIDVPYDESLVLWHVATEFSHNDYHDPVNVFSENNSGARIRVTNTEVDLMGYVEMSKTLSDYMMYLLIMQPDIMAPVGGIGKRRFQHTCAVAKRFFDGKYLGPSQQVEACNYILEADDQALQSVEENGTSVLFKARKLAKVLRELEVEKKWPFICQLWVELLCYAAGHCRGRALEQQLSKGGEFVTFVWLLMSHFGIRVD